MYCWRGKSFSVKKKWEYEWKQCRDNADCMGRWFNVLNVETDRRLVREREEEKTLGRRYPDKKI
jgi:hypothetical protein